MSEVGDRIEVATAKGAPSGAGAADGATAPTGPRGLLGRWWQSLPAADKGILTAAAVLLLAIIAVLTLAVAAAG